MTVSGISTGTSAALTSIQASQSALDTSLKRLSTGRSVNSVADNPQAYLLAQGLTDRAQALSQVGSAIGQGIGALQAANDGLTAINQLVGQMKGMALAAQSNSDPTQITAYQNQYNALAGQIDQVAADASYNGVNLIQSTPSSLTVAAPSGTTTVAGQAADSATLGITPAAGWATNSGNIQGALSALDQASQTVSGISSNLGSNITTLQIQAQFTQNLGNTLTSGAAKLTTADLAQEATNAVAASTYRSLGQAALRSSVKSDESVLAIFGRGA